MKKSTLAAQSGAGIAVLALLTTLAQADSVRYSDISDLELNMETAAMIASDAISGAVIEAELEMEDSSAIWEVDIVNENNQVITVEIDGQTGNVLSTRTEDDSAMPVVSSVSLAQAVSIVMAVEEGSMIEAELENEHGELVWEIESLNTSNQKTKFHVHAETGEILN